MAEALPPLIGQSIDYHDTPIAHPPTTVFPYPKSTQPPGLAIRERDGSDATLNDERPEKDGAPQIVSAQHRSMSAPRSPGAESIEQRHTPATQNRRPSNNIQSANADLPPNYEPDDSSSDSGFSSEDEDQTADLDHARSQPGRGELAPQELNRARMRPWHEKKRHMIRIGNDHFKSYGKIAKDGRLNVKISEMANSGYLAKALGTAIRGHLSPHDKDTQQEEKEAETHHQEHKNPDKVPRMNIVIMVIGSRGDVQPFLKIGQVLRDRYGHRVRIATHPAFQKFVQDEIGLEFFSIGGDPSELMSFMVRNPGLIPSLETLTSGEVGRRREQMFEMFNGFWRACINATDQEKDTSNLKMLNKKPPFIADAIIANPVSFAHYHCAERLGVPLHLVFTFPYTPTAAFPHPLANIKATNVDREYTNFMSYPLVDLMTWQGLGDLVNRFRVKTLGLEPVSTLWAPGQITRLRVPMTYLWSPGLVPKPEDWGPEIDIAGYVFLDLASSYKPEDDLKEFLRRDQDSRPLIYIGFGSIAGIKDTTAFCNLLFEAVKAADVRAVISKGWGDMGKGLDIPDGVFMVDNVPHDWLFPQMDAVCHHGGAGTTAAGLRYGKPTMIVPFFGDQPFWAQMIVRADAGAKQVWPLKKLTVERFATSIKECLRPAAKENAQAISKSIALEGDGADNAVNAFHRGLESSCVHSVACDVFEDRIAVWSVRHTDFRLSALAASLLVESKRISWDDLDLLRHKDWADFSGPGEPVTGAGGVIVGAFQEAVHGISSIHEDAKADLKRIGKHRERKKSRAETNAKTEPRSQLALTDGHSADSQDEGDAKVNLTGAAEPVRNPTVAGLLGDSGTARPHASRTQTTSTLEEPAPVLLAKDVGRGVGHSLKSIVLLPSEMLHAVTLGFRNAPRLYGDKTVRPPPHNIHGFRQGSKTAGKEFWFGIYDGSTGLVRIPYLDVKEAGLSGLPKGVARGLGGLVLKPIAGTLGLFDYTNRGLYASLKKLVKDTEKTERWIREARLVQGAVEAKALQGQDRKQDDTHTKPEKGQLEHARTRALNRFTPDDQRKLEDTRKQEEQPSLLPGKSSKLKLRHKSHR